MIKMTAIGHLGRDCVINNVNGKSVINFSLAHTEKFRDASGVNRDKTIWVECAWWTDRTGAAPYLKKGTQVYVEGNPEVKTYQTNDGRQGASLTLRVISLQLLGGSQQNSNGSQQYSSGAQGNYSQGTNNQPTYQNANELTEPLDDIPF